jgi:hypothetical protein
MSNITKSQGARTGGCGCSGGSSGASSGSCGCNTAVCRDAPLSRPRFFGGQLLTEEDLQLLIDYVVGKNRLRNRHLFGSGVVCGLTLTCHPCGGKVVVAPGYAIDCCGNDIYVPCAEQLDVNALVRELRLATLPGYDCGDPCQGAGQKDGETRRYCLYVRYDERDSDPVAPYLSDAPCGQGRCETTRISETYTFELGCNDESGAPPDVLDRLAICIGDLRIAAGFFERAENANGKATYLAGAAAAARAHRAEIVTDTDATNVAAAKSTLEEFQKGRGSTARGAAAAAKDVAEKPAEEEFRKAAAAFQVVAANAARLNALPPDKRKEAVELFRKHGASPADLTSVLTASAPTIREGARQFGDQPELRDTAIASVELAETYSIKAAPAEAYATGEAQMFMTGAAVKSAQVASLQEQLAALKAWLRERIESSCSQTSCDLLVRLDAIRIEQEPQGRIDVAQVERMANSIRALISLLLDYLRDCICLALNPVCSDCTDARVLLACLQVRDCEVIDICNMSRRFVLSPQALRYWLPPLSALGTLVEKFCCETEFDLSAPDPQPPDLYRQDKQFIARRSVQAPKVADLGSGAVVAATAVGLDTVRLDLLSSVGVNLGGIAAGNAPLQLRERALTATRGVLDSAVLTRRMEEFVDARVQQEVDRTLKASGKRIASEADLKKVQDESKKVQEDNRKLHQELERLRKTVDSLKK